MNVLPDEVWRALNPPRVKQRWWLAVQLHDPRWATPRVGRVGLTPLVMSLFMILIHIPLIILTSLGLIPPLVTGACYAMWGLLVILWYVVKQLRLRRLVVAENEVYGRLLPIFRHWWYGTRADVAVFSPQEPTRSLAEQVVSISQKQYERLGGQNAAVRAWYRDGKAFVYLQPSVRAPWDSSAS